MIMGSSCLYSVSVLTPKCAQFQGPRGYKGSKGAPGKRGQGYENDADFPTGFIQGPPGEPGKPGKRVRVTALISKNRPRKG